MNRVGVRGLTVVLAMIAVSAAGGSTDALALGVTPTVSNVAPSAGRTAGGTTVTITGTNFSTRLTTTTAVKFGSASATSFTVNSETSITAVSPPGAGTVDVTVTTPVGTSEPSAADHFAYVPPPTVSGISPNEGPEGGGMAVSVTGAHLSMTSAVKFGSASATSFTVNSESSITAVSPPGAGTVDVTVTTSFGTSEANAADHFTYTAAGTAAVAWGANGVAQLGAGYWTSSWPESPVRVIGVTNVTAVVADYYSSFALLGDGIVRSWGGSDRGQLGDGSRLGTDAALPVEVCAVGTVGACPTGPYLSEVKAISASGAHELALLKSGKVVAWGSNDWGQLGQEEGPEQRGASLVPIEVKKLDHVIAIASGGGANFALREDGTVWAWGKDLHAQLGLNEYGGPEKCKGEGAPTGLPCSTFPRRVVNISEATAISAGELAAYAVLRDGEVMAWGDNEFGQLGTGLETDSADPLKVQGLRGRVVAVSGGDRFALALRDNGEVEGWGGNGSGEIGGTSPEQCGKPGAYDQCSRTAKLVSGLTSVTAISAGQLFSLALSGGTVYSFGYGADGRLGNGSMAGTHVPTAIQIEGSPPVGGISAGEKHGLAFLQSGSGPTSLLSAKAEPSKTYALKVVWTFPSPTNEYKIHWESEKSGKQKRIYLKGASCSPRTPCEEVLPNLAIEQWQIEVASGKYERGNNADEVSRKLYATPVS